MDGYLHLQGWQWIFIAEGIPAIALGIVTYAVLVDHPRDAGWLSSEERNALLEALDRERSNHLQDDFLAALKTPAFSR